MSAPLLDLVRQINPVTLFRARSKVLAREHRRTRAQLIRIRRDRGLTQAGVAVIMGVSQQAVNKLERYDADPKLSTLRRYANAVGALIEHQVSRDDGQSVLLASRPQWESVGTLPRVDETHLVVSASSPSGHSAWSESKRTDFALSA